MDWKAFMYAAAIIVSILSDVRGASGQSTKSDEVTAAQDSGDSAQKPKTDVMPAAVLRHYEATSHNTDFLTGDLELSKTYAKYTKLSGHMNLEYAGRRDGRPGDIEARGDVYKVLNAEEYFMLNKGKNGFCHEPIRWLTIFDMSDLFTFSMSIRVTQLSVDDWHDYRDDRPYFFCGAGTYQLSSSLQ